MSFEMFLHQINLIFEFHFLCGHGVGRSAAGTACVACGICASQGTEGQPGHLLSCSALCLLLLLGGFSAKQIAAI